MLIKEDFIERRSKFFVKICPGVIQSFPENFCKSFPGFLTNQTLLFRIFNAFCDYRKFREYSQIASLVLFIYGVNRFNREQHRRLKFKISEKCENAGTFTLAPITIFTLNM